MSGIDGTTVSLWTAVVASGVYHGLNPGMGWPLAVSAGLMERSTRAFWMALGSLALGHLLSMLVSMLPFVLLAALLTWQRQIQIGVSVLLIGFGCWLLLWPGHPRALVRIPPSHLVLWSFAVAMTHGAGLMLVPVYVGLCRSGEAAGVLINSNLNMALLVSLVHASALFLAGGLLAWSVYRYLGLKFVSRSWFNLDAIWALSLVLIGALSLLWNLTGMH